MIEHTIKLESLLDLREELRRAGFDPGAQRVIAAHNLLLGLAAHGRLPEDPAAWRTWLAPVFCATPQQQREFEARYKGWLDRNFSRAERTRARESRQRDAGRGAASETARAVRWKERLRRLAQPRSLGMTGAVLALAALLLGAWMLSSKSLLWEGQVFSEDEQHPLAGATVRFAEQQTVADAEGRFKLDWRIRNWEDFRQTRLLRQDRVERLVVAHPDHFSRESDLSFYRPTPQRIVLAKRRDPVKTPGDGAPPPPPPDIIRPLPVRDLSLRNWQLALILAPLAVSALWLVVIWLLRRAILRKLPDSRLPQLHELKIEGAERKLFASPRVRQALLGLRRPRPMAVRELDARATVRATIREGGVFTPTYGARRASPEYLLLIDRASAQDEQARVADELCARLTENGVFVEPYYFQGDARSCRSARRADEAAVTLRHLAGRYPEHRLLVFGDGASFFETFTGRPHRWLAQLAHWEARALLMPEPPAPHGDREQELRRRDFLLLPAGAEGLEALAEWFGLGVAPRTDGGFLPAPFPEMIEERPLRWLERLAPPPDDIAELARQVRAYLGPDGWEWLAACAAYPEITWDLMLFYDFWLFGRDDAAPESRADRILRLVRLPWFRYGAMPDWWRTHLLDSLAPARRALVLRAIERLLGSALHPENPVPLQYAEPEARGWRARLRAWRDRLSTWLALQTVEREEPLRDYVFLQFLAGRRPDRLSVLIPDALRRLFFKDGHAGLGPNSITLFALACLVSLSLSLFAWFYLRPRTGDDPPGPVAIAIPRPTVPPGVSFTPTPAVRTSPTPTPFVVRQGSDGYVVELGNNLTLDLVALPGGEFTMGSDQGDSYEKPPHRVRVAALLHKYGASDRLATSSLYPAIT